MVAHNAFVVKSIVVPTLTSKNITDEEELIASSGTGGSAIGATRATNRRRPTTMMSFGWRLASIVAFAERTMKVTLFAKKAATYKGP